MAIASVPPEAIRPAQVGLTLAHGPTITSRNGSVRKLLTVPPEHCELLLVALALGYKGHAMPVPYRGHC